jgi:hypothetical protein
MFWKVLAPAVSFVLGAAAIFIVLIVAHSYGYVAAFPDPAKQIEALAVYLAAATLVVTAVGVLVAVFAIIGYVAIKTGAVEAAKKAGAEAGEKAIAPILARERLVRGLTVPETTDEVAVLDPLTRELAKKED